MGHEFYLGMFVPSLAIVPGPQAWDLGPTDARPSTTQAVDNARATRLD